MPTGPIPVPINLQAGICTDTPLGADLFEVGDPAAKHLVNTGMERNGGLTPIYEKETTFPTAGLSTMIAKDGTVIEVDSSNNVRLNDTVIGNVGDLTVYNRGILTGYLDAAWTADDTIIAFSLSGQTIVFVELNPATLAILHTRNITFGALVTNNWQSILFVRYVDMHYADNQEWIIRYYVTTQDSILKEAGTTITDIAGVGINAVGFAHRFGVNQYIWGDQGNSVLPWKVGDILLGGGGFTVQTNGIWCIIDRFRGIADSRAILTYDVLKTPANLLAGYSTVGYDGAGAWNATQVDQGLVLGLFVVATIQDKINGPGYSEATYIRSDTGTNIYSYHAHNISNVSLYFLTTQTQTHTPINAYGRLSHLAGNAVFLVAWRMCLINGVMSYLAASKITTSAEDEIGVPLTLIGEIDPFYVCHIVDTATYSRIIYKYNGNLFFIDIRASAGHAIEKISDNVYQMNCLSPISIVDIKKKTLELGINDYNGRLLPHSVDVIASTSKVSSILSGEYSNSIDVGDKLVTLTIAIGSYAVLGNAQPDFWVLPLPYSIRIFSNDVYQYSDIIGIEPKYTDTVYIPDTRLPVAMGYHYETNVAFSELITLLLGVGIIGSADIDISYVGYELGNDIIGHFQAFQLFGQTYLFDGMNIWLSSFNGSLFNGKGNFPVAPATGMLLIAISPTEIFFLSSFDNSIYVFTGGRSLTKYERMNQQDTFSAGVFSVHDNTLLLNGTNSLVWVRDGVVSENAKKANQAGVIGLYDTVNGIIIANLTKSWQYTFFTQGGATVVPFTWQSGYFGVTQNRLGVATGFFLTLYSAINAATTIVVTIDGFDQDGSFHEEKFFTINAGDWDSFGFWRSARVIPQHTLGLGVSLGLKTTGYFVLNNAYIEFTPDTTATPRAARSA